MENVKLFETEVRNPCRVKRSLEEFGKLKKKAQSLDSGILQERFFDLALLNLDKAIENQRELEDELVEGCEHYNLCFEKILFLEETGKHGIACGISSDLVLDIPEYSSILLDAADSCCTAGNQEEARDYRDIWEFFCSQD
jgi:hypothetical protein